MSDAATWHYGLVARWWSEFNVGGPELDFYKALVEQHGGPALDVGCGTGRLLVPMAQAGLDIDGCDVSPDMIALCRTNADAVGVSPGLYTQPMHELDIARRYRTIFSCGSIGLGGGRQALVEALRRCHAQLEAGGTLAVDTGGPSIDRARLDRRIERIAESLHVASADSSGDGSANWSDRRRCADGDEIEMRTQTIAIDRAKQIMTQQIEARLWHDGEIVEQETHQMRILLIASEEILEAIREAGFATPTIIDGYQDGIGGPGPTVVYTAIK